MKQIILGTAGHIDHGKTSLIKAVTGTETDRLKEEKLRGITIELGFADLDLPNGHHLGIIDVPGHEKFVKNMVAGATGIDMVAMVIAADEGVMPQTREHMEICTLLGIRHGLFVLTKVDLVDEEWLELVLEDVHDFALGTFLEGADVLLVSTLSGQGIPEFVNALERLSGAIPERQALDLFRLPVDRVFTMKGFGTVITGSLISGRVSVGDTLTVYPTGVTAKVRGIQVHNSSVDQAVAGMRTAINFQGLDKNSVQRGDVMGKPGELQASYMLDISLRYLNSNQKPIKHRAPVRFHTGTSEILGHLILLDSEELAPGETTMAQVHLRYPVTVVRDDRYVIRSYSPIRTIGGGRVLNPIPVKHKRFKPDTMTGLDRLKDADPAALVIQQVLAAGYSGVVFSALKLMVNQSDKKLNDLLQDLLSKKIIMLVDREGRRYVHHDHVKQLHDTLRGFLDAFHRAHPLKSGMSKEELKSKFPSLVDRKLLNLVMTRMLKQGDIIQEEKTVRLAAHRVSLGKDQVDVRKKITRIYRESGLTPPYFRELVKSLDSETDNAKDVLMLLVAENKIIKAKEDLYFDARAVERLEKRLVDFLKAHGEITTPQFKDMTGVSRKYVIPLAEYFDARNVTLRVGDTRKLRGG